MHDKIITVAKKAARRLARATGTPYQTCLDIVAQKAGRAHWSAFLADPVDVSNRPAPMAATPTEVYAPEPPPIIIAPIRDHVVEVGIEEDQNAAPPLRSRIMRMLIGPERGIVKRSIGRRMLARSGRVKCSSTFGMPLGRSVENGYDLVLDETLPVLALSPPGTGKTASVVVPTIIACDCQSLVIHDEVGLAEMTSGYRATLGPVTILDLAGTRSSGSLNPLSRSWIPIDPVARASYLATLSRALAPHDTASSHLIERTLHDLTSGNGGTTFLLLDQALRRNADHFSLTAARLLSPFLDPAVQACTTTEGYLPQYLRGGRHQDRSIYPTTVYIVRGAAGNERQGVVAVAIQSAIWWWTLSVGPGMRSPDGDVHGVCPVTVILEDAHRLPVMPELSNAIERGRAWKLGHLVTAPSYRAMSRTVGADMDELEALFPVQIILSQNDPTTMARLERRLYGVTRQDLVELRDTHLVVLQHEAEAIRVRSPYFFTRPEMLAKVYNPRSRKGPRPLTM